MPCHRLLDATFPPVAVPALTSPATSALDKVTDRVTYDQDVLLEFGWISEGKGTGIDRKGSGYSQI